MILFFLFFGKWSRTLNITFAQQVVIIFPFFRSSTIRLGNGMNNTGKSGFFLWREMDVLEEDSKQCFLQQEIWWSSSYSAGPQVHIRTNMKLMLHYSVVLNAYLVFPPAVVLILVLLVDLMSGKNFDNNILFGLYVIQVSFRSLWPDSIGVWLYYWGAGYNTVLVHFRQLPCPCKASWTVWFMLGDGPILQKPFLERTHPWWHMATRPSLMSHWGPVDSKHNKRHCWLTTKPHQPEKDWLHACHKHFIFCTFHDLSHKILLCADWAWRKHKLFQLATTEAVPLITAQFNWCERQLLGSMMVFHCCYVQYWCIMFCLMYVCYSIQLFSTMRIIDFLVKKCSVLYA